MPLEATEWRNPRLATRELVKLGDAGRWRDALGVLHCLAGPSELSTLCYVPGDVDAIHTSAAIRACGKAAAWEAAIALLEGVNTLRVDKDGRGS